MSHEELENKRRLAVAIDLSLKEPYLDILDFGSLATCHKAIPKDTDLFIYHSKKPNRFWKYFDSKVEVLRGNSGKWFAYSTSYALMFFLSPIRLWLPRVKHCGRYSDGNAAQRLSISLPESRSFQRWKKLAALKHVLDENDYRWIVLTTPSYYINYRQILGTIELMESKGFSQNVIYAGDTQSSADGNFVSGGWILLNKSAAKLLIENRRLAPVHVYDDISFGVVFQKLGVPITQISESGFLKNSKMEDKELRRYPYIRLSSGLPDGTRNDVALFQEIHAKKL